MECRRLRALLACAPANRTDRDYEKVFDEFVVGIGGNRIDLLVKPPSLNADYSLRIDNTETVAELKLIQQRTVSLTELSGELIRTGKITSGITRNANGTITVTPKEMTPRDRSRLYSRWGRIFDDKLKHANRQIRQIAPLIQSTTHRVNGVVFLNAGNYQFTTSRMSNIVGVFLNRKWAAGHYRAIDYAISLTIDLFTDAQHPLNGAAIANPAKKEISHPFVTALIGRWIEYLAAGYGTSLSYSVGYQPSPDVSDTPYTGKIRIVA